MIFLTDSISAFFSSYSSKGRRKFSIISESLNDAEVLKMSKKGILIYFKQLLAYKELEAKIKYLETSSLNIKYLKLKGNLNVRGIIEEFEQTDLFKQCRQRLTSKVTVTDEASNSKSVENRPPSRKVLWDEAMKDKEFTSFLACIAKSNPERRDTIGERVRDLYSSLSRNVHKHADSDAVLIMKSSLYDHEVSD